MNDVLARPLPPPRVRHRVVATAAVLDVVVVLVFAALGRSTHHEAFSMGGVLGTAWPFLVALVLGWVGVRAWRHPLRMWPSAVIIWVCTWGLGMLVRALSGGGTALPFVLVALGTLGLGLLGWRPVARFAPSVRSTYPGLSQD